MKLNMEIGARNAVDNGGSFQVSHDIDSAYAGADIVYAKSWGALPYFGSWAAEKPIRDRYRHFIVDEAENRLHVQKAVMAALATQ